MGSEKSQQSTSPRHRRAAAVVAVALMVATAVGVLALWERRAPVRQAHVATPAPAPDSTVPNGSAASSASLSLRGVPLRAPTHLRLLVADAPAPFVLDVDGGSSRPITGLPTDGDRGASVDAVGEDALVSSVRLCNRCRPDGGVYVVRRGSTAATRLGRLLEAVSSRDGEGVWTLGRRDASRCTIRELDLDGGLRRPARQARCRTDLVAALPAGLLISSVGPLGRDAHSALIEPSGHIVRLGAPHVQPVVGNFVLSGADRHTPLVLRDVRSGARHRLPWPSGPGYSLAEVTGGPNGRLAIVRFARFSPRHILDMWLLDTRTRRWEHLPGMPARIVPKATDVEWTPDGRVVILAGEALGVWRPGWPELAVARVRGANQPGSNFIVW